MRVIIEVQDEAELARVVGALREARVDVTLGGNGAPEPGAFEALLEDTRGLWTAGDGLAYQNTVRSEWDRP